jgi:enoyl-CoA hydratase/carnithine racemase
MDFTMLQIEREEKLAVVTLNRPEKRNALSIAFRDEIDHCFEQLAADDSVRVVVLLANGTSFCAGFDLKEFVDRRPENLAAVFQSSDRYHRRICDFPKPIVAGIQGPAMGGGFDLAVLCDVRIATPQTCFAHPEIKFGAQALFGPLRELVGGGIARDLVLTGREMDADEALRVGLVSRIVEPAALRQACLETARTIAESPLPTLRGIKGQIVRSYSGWDGHQRLHNVLQGF